MLCQAHALGRRGRKPSNRVRIHTALKEDFRKPESETELSEIYVVNTGPAYTLPQAWDVFWWPPQRTCDTWRSDGPTRSAAYRKSPPPVHPPT